MSCHPASTHLVFKMTPLVLFGLIVGVYGAPQLYNHHGELFPHSYDYPSPYVSESLFDTGRFWADLSNEMRQLNTMMADLHRRFSINAAAAGFEDNKYKITIPLNGFEENDIVVKAKEGVLMVQAVHKIDNISQNSYLDVRTLPNSVDISGSWKFEKGILKIEFPLKSDSENPEHVTTEIMTTAGYKEQSREELDTNNQGGNENADIGLDENERDRNRQLITNEISGNSIEATTYAVDAKNEVEFVPVPY